MKYRAEELLHKFETSPKNGQSKIKDNKVGNKQKKIVQFRA